MASRITIHPLQESDLPDLVAFLDAQAGREGVVDAPTSTNLDTLRWYLFENPEIRDDLPKGLIARDEQGRIVGNKHCAPQRFQCAGQEFVLLLGGGYYVSSEHRGVGLRLMRAFLETSDRVSQFASTMNEVSGAIYERYGGYPIPDTEHEMVGLLRWGPFVEEVLARRIPGWLPRVAAGVASVLPSAVRGAPVGTLEEISSADELGRLHFETPEEHAKQITALRSERFLRWRYFQGPDRTRRIFRYLHPSGQEGLVTMRIGRRGLRGQIRALSVLDYWGALPQSAVGDVSRLLARRFAGEVDTLVWRGQPPARQAELRRMGFMRRALPRAIGVCIDTSGRLPTREWYMVPADGDMSL